MKKQRYNTAPGRGWRLAAAGALALGMTVPAGMLASKSLTLRTLGSEMLRAVGVEALGGPLVKAVGLGEADVKGAGEMLKVPAREGLMLNGPARSGETRPGDVFFCPFDERNEETMAPLGWVVVDANGDGAEDGAKRWRVGSVDGENCALINWNSSMAMDDWMISPAVTFEGGKAYEFSFDMWGKGDAYPEKVEVFIGKTQDVAGMTITAIPVCTYGNATPKTFSNVVFIPEGGQYYIGVHGCSAKDMYTLFVDNVRVGAGVDAGVPNSPTDITVEPSGAGEPTAAISFKAPATLLNGQPASNMTKIEVKRGDVVAKTFTNPSAGAELSFTDECGYGAQTWAFTAYNATGASVTAYASAEVSMPATVPYFKNFPTASSLDEMTIIDGDGDGNTWGWDQYQKYAKHSHQNQNGVANDWLISAPIMLKGNKAYELTSLVSCGNPEAFPPRVAFYIGKGRTAADMTTAIFPATQLTKYDNNIKESFSVAEDGLYYIGVNACTTEWLGLIKLMNFGITGGASMDAPSQVLDAMIEPDWTSRTLNTEVSFTAPVLTGAGNPVTSITKIELSRNDDVVYTWSNPQPGSEYSTTDTAPAAGEYTYKIVAFNDEGHGTAFERTVELGKVGKPVPYVEDFKSGDRFENELTFIDYNEDGQSFWHASAIDPPYAWIHYGSASPTNDDYLITPAIAMEANTRYIVSAQALGHNEGLEFLAGTAPKVDALTQTVRPLQTLTENWQLLTAEFTSTYAGNYFFAFHVQSDKRYESFQITDIRITKVGLLTAPGAVTDLTYTPGTGNELQFSFKAPATTLAGDALESLAAVTVMRGSQTIKTFDNPAPGAALSFSDTPAAGGEYTYTFTASNAEGPGAVETLVAFCGTDVPAKPQNVKATALENGKVRVTWDPVTTTAHGAAVPAAGYIVLEVNGEKQTQKPMVTACEFEYDAITDPNEQAALYYGVFPVNADGDTGEYGLSNTCFAGNPYKMMFRESFSNGQIKSAYQVESLLFGAQWILCTHETFSDVQPSDADKGMIAMQGSSNTTGRFSTGFINLKDNSVNPTLKFKVYNISPTEYDNKLYIDVLEEGSDTWTEVAGGEIRNLSPEAGWTTMKVDLGAYKNKNIRIGFRVMGATYRYTIFDAITVGNLSLKDLGVTLTPEAFQVPSGENVALNLMVLNNGEQDVQGYTVTLYKNGQEVKVWNPSGTLVSGGIRELRSNQTLDIHDLDVNEFHAEVSLQGDENPSDNVTDTYNVEVLKPIHPVVENLAANHDNGTVTLNWDEPSMANVAPAPTVEGFEGAESWNRTGYGNWKFIDMDDKAVAGFQQFDIPGITVGVTKASFFVLDSQDNSLGGYESLLAGMEGSRKCLGALLCYDQGVVNDWVVSPELYGGRQVVTFHAKSLLEDYVEKFQVYYSTSGNNVSDFVPVGPEFKTSGDAWGMYTASLPEGAKYFAIRRITNGGALFMVDDISLRFAGNDPETLNLVGYNVYRNGERLNTAPLTAKTFADSEAETGTHRYSVSALYEQGESNTQHVSVDVTQSGVTETTVAKAAVAGVAGRVIVRGAEGQHVAVASADGKLLYNGRGSNVMDIKAQPGVYAVTVGNSTFKVLVK